MSEVTRIGGTTLEFIDQMANRMRLEEQEDFKRVYGTVWEGLMECCLQSTGELTTVLIDGELAAIFGVRAHWGGGGAFGMPWLALTQHAERHPLTVYRTAKQEMKRMVDVYAFMHNFVPADDEPAIRLLERLGFRVHKQVNDDGTRMFAFSRSEDQVCA